MTKQQLSERIAELYGVPVSKYVTGLEDVLLIDDTARMFELAVENDIEIRHREESVWANPKTPKFKIERVVYNDHPTKLEATLWAIGLALVKKGESK